MANSPVNYSPILRRLRANSSYKGPSAAKEDILTSPLSSSSGSRSSSVSEEDSRWRPRSFDSFFQESNVAQNGGLLDDFDHLRPFHNTSVEYSSSSTPSPSSTARHTVLSESAPTHRTRSPHGEGVASSSSPSSSASSSPSTLSPPAKLAPRQLFDQQQQQQQQQEATSPNTSDSDSNEVNLFNSYNAYTNAYTSPLSFSASSVPVRARAEASLGSRLAGSMAGAVAHAMAAANRPSPPRSASVDLGAHFIPLAKSFSDGEIEVKFSQERGSSQSPLRLLAARNNLETPTNSPPREGAQMVALTSSDDLDHLADYDSEMGSSDYDSEEEGPMVAHGPGGDAGRRASVSAASGANFMRKRVLWQRSRSLSGKSSGYQAFRSSMKSSAGAGAQSSSSSSGLRWVGLWLYLLLALEVASLFYVGYTFRLSYSAISLNEFGGFMEKYPQADEGHVGWKENPVDTCHKYLAWLHVRLSETRGKHQRVGQPGYASPAQKPRQPWYRLKKSHRHRAYR